MNSAYTFAPFQHRDRLSRYMDSHKNVAVKEMLCFKVPRSVDKYINICL